MLYGNIMQPSRRILIQPMAYGFDDSYLEPIPYE